MEQETGKNTLATAKRFATTYKAPLVVGAVILAAVAIDYGFRSSDRDFYSKGLTSMSAQKWDAAISSFSRALRQNPADPASRFALGWAYHSKGWVDEALKQYEQAGKGGAESASSAFFNMGVIQQAKRNLDEAAVAYQRAIQINPNANNAVYNLAFVYQDKGQHEAALTQFKKTLTAEPRNVNAIYYCGLASERLGRKDEAKKYYQQALSVDPNYQWAKDRLKALGG